MGSRRMNIEELEKKLNPKHVSQHPFTGMDYIQGWHAIAEANRIFGFDGWTRETVYNKEVARYPAKIGKGQYEKDGWKVCYEAKVSIKVFIGNDDYVERTGTGHGTGQMTDLADCIEGAAKEAETDAMKRALMTFGNQFGLALYDKKKLNVGIDKPELTPEQKLVKASQFVDDSIETIEIMETVEEVNTWMGKNTKALSRIITSYPELNETFENARVALIDRINIGE